MFFFFFFSLVKDGVFHKVDFLVGVKNGCFCRLGG